jgi:predicted PurR-regulated permease PerM
MPVPSAGYKFMPKPKSLTKPFLLILVLLVIAGSYLLLKPFLVEILIAALLVSVFYTPFTWFAKFLRGRRNLAAILMCLLLVALIIVPLTRLLIYGGSKSITAYNSAVEFFNNNSVNDFFQKDFFADGPLRHLNLGKYDFNNDAFKETALSVLQKSSNWLISGATIFVKGTTNFIISLVFIILTMFFFFVDGPKILERLMYLSPLPNQYDNELFRKFRSVSYTIFISTFVAAAAQGLVGALGFAIVGFPALLAGIIIALLSLIPYVGSMIFYFPVGIYYLLAGNVWQGIFILLWGFLIIGTTDNIIRAYMIKDRAEVNPIFVLFSILGGIMLFGFWGVILGPLIVALAVTVFHLYELEFCDTLEMPDCDNKKKESAKEWKEAKKELKEIKEDIEEFEERKDLRKKIGK